MCERELHRRFRIGICAAVLAAILLLMCTAAGGRFAFVNCARADAEGATDNAADNASDAVAQSLDITIKDNQGTKQSKFRDNSYKTRVSYKKDDAIKITSETPMAGIYIRWGSEVPEYTITYNGTTETHGENGFLHDYVALASETTEVIINIRAEVSICEIAAYSAGRLPDDVQVWEPSLEAADILVLSTHADDEVLFMGGVLAQYGGQEKRRVQVVYMCEFWSTEHVREHEKLDGLWTSGIRNYPTCMGFKDKYSTTLEGAKKTYVYDDIKTAVTETIRRFRPLVIVTHDINGEYGHGGHMILNAAVREVIEHTDEAEFEPESAQQYGTWDVPKTYFHLYGENKLRMNMREPLSEFGGKTALEVAQAAYKKHESQQWCWFYVSDDYEYSVADFGLYRTTVGQNTTDDMLENVVTYEEQERIEEEKRLEEERLAEQKRLEEEARRAEEERLAEQKRLEEEAKVTEAAKLTEAAKKEEAAKAAKASKSGESGGNRGTLIAAIVIAVIAFAVAGIGVMRHRTAEKKRAELRRKRRAKRAAQQSGGASAAGK